MIIQNADETCGSAIAKADHFSGGSSITLPILRKQFLQSVAIFDVGMDEMKFAKRVNDNGAGSRNVSTTTTGRSLRSNTGFASSSSSSSSRLRKRDCIFYSSGLVAPSNFQLQF